MIFISFSDSLRFSLENWDIFESIPHFLSSRGIGLQRTNTVIWESILKTVYRIIVRISLLRVVRGTFRLSEIFTKYYCWPIESPGTVSEMSWYRLIFLDLTLHTNWESWESMPWFFYPKKISINFIIFVFPGTTLFQRRRLKAPTISEYLTRTEPLTLRQKADSVRVLCLTRAPRTAWPSRVK
jgi:hypothetical protein